MKSMKGINLNRVLGSLKRRSYSIPTASSGDDTPEGLVARNLILFCESGKPGEPGESDEELLYLPILVDVCESSPSASKEAAHLIRKFISRENCNRPHVQYNAVMLIRILAENPGSTFTRNFDAKFVQTLKELLRVGQDPDVRHLLIETLDKFQREKSYLEGMEILLEMWHKEQERMIRRPIPPPRFPIPNVPLAVPLAHVNPQNYLPPDNSDRQLPSPHELSMRIEEASTSAKLLTDMIISTSASEISKDELALELANRCQAASRSMQTYIAAEDPAPDNDTMETLIETNEKLSKALSEHQRAILRGRKSQEKRPIRNLTPDHAISSRSSPGPSSKPSSRTASKSPPSINENPFSDPREERYNSSSTTIDRQDLYEKNKTGLSGPDTSSSNDRKNEPLPKIPVYRY